MHELQKFLQHLQECLFYSKIYYLLRTVEAPQVVHGTHQTPLCVLLHLRWVINYGFVLIVTGPVMREQQDNRQSLGLPEKEKTVQTSKLRHIG